MHFDDRAGRFAVLLSPSHTLRSPPTLRFSAPLASLCLVLSVWSFRGRSGIPYNRGVNRQNIFFDEIDRELFLTILARTVPRYGWLVHAWVQMTHHYLLLVETPQTNLSAGMHDLDGVLNSPKRRDRLARAGRTKIARPISRSGP